MIKHPMRSLSLRLVMLCAVSLAACGRRPASRTLSAEEVPPPPVPASVPVNADVSERAAAASVLTQRIGFGFDDASLSTEAKATLTEKVTVLRTSPAMRLRLEGHADERGSEGYNKELGMRRALAAKRYLVQKGISPQRLYVISYGTRRPLDPAHTEAAWSRNRRVEFALMNEPVGSGR